MIPGATARRGPFWAPDLFTPGPTHALVEPFSCPRTDIRWRARRGHVKRPTLFACLPVNDSSHAGGRALRITLSRSGRHCAAHGGLPRHASLPTSCAPQNAMPNRFGSPCSAIIGADADARGRRREEYRILGLDLGTFAACFVQAGDTPFLLVRADAARSQAWAQLLGVPARRCYISDDKLVERARAAGVAGSAIAAATVPDPGSVMSGDFGEIITAFYLAASSRPVTVIDPLRWRYKADRRKAAPGSDVVQMLLPHWPQSSSDDRIVCAEAKAKATRGRFDPIAAARAGSATDRAGRLVNTLEWLKDKALTEGSDVLEIAQLDRFLKAVDHPQASWEFCAVAIIDSNLVDDEVARGAAPPDEECTLIVISVPELKLRYTELFQAIVDSADELVGANGSPPVAERAMEAEGAASALGALT